jgi:hypothetical protein
MGDNGRVFTVKADEITYRLISLTTLLFGEPILLFIDIDGLPNRYLK